MNIAAISSASMAGNVGVVHNTGTSTYGQVATTPKPASAVSSSANVTNVVTMTDGATVTTVRDKAGQIVSITTSPPTRPPEITSPKPTSSHLGGLGGRIDLTA